eukprot:gene5871-9699_t
MDTNCDNIVSITEIEEFLSQFDLQEDVKVQKYLREHDEELTFVEFTDLYCDYMDIDLKQEINHLKNKLEKKKSPKSTVHGTHKHKKEIEKSKNLNGLLSPRYDKNTIPKISFTEELHDIEQDLAKEAEKIITQEKKIQLEKKNSFNFESQNSSENASPDFLMSSRNFKETFSHVEDPKKRQEEMFRIFGKGNYDAEESNVKISEEDKKSEKERRTSLFSLISPRSFHKRSISNHTNENQGRSKSILTSPRRKSTKEPEKDIQNKLKYLYSDMTESQKELEIEEEMKKKEKLKQETNQPKKLKFLFTEEDLKQKEEEEKHKSMNIEDKKKSRRMTLDLGKLTKNATSLFQITSRNDEEEHEKPMNPRKQTIVGIATEKKEIKRGRGISLMKLNLSDVSTNSDNSTHNSLQSTNSIFSLISPRYHSKVDEPQAPEIRKIQKPWSKKRSGGVHFLTEFGQNIQKEIQKRHAEEIEDHLKKLKLIGIGEAHELFTISEEKVTKKIKEHKKKKKKGYLKMKQKFTGTFKNYYCVLRSDKFIYYSSKKSYLNGAQQSGSIFLISASIDFVDNIKHHPYSFNLISRGFDNIFDCDDKDERDEWVHEIRNVISDYYTSHDDQNIKVKNPTYNDKTLHVHEYDH